MKQFLAGLVVGIVIATASVGFATEGQLPPIRLFVNGTEITLPDAQPVVIDNRVMVPIMAFSQVAGFGVRWEEATRSVYVTTLKQTSAQSSTQTMTQTSSLKKVVDGVTYYELNSLAKLLRQLRNDPSIGAGGSGILIGDTLYGPPAFREGNRAYMDARPLIADGILTEEQLRNAYGE